MTSIKAGSYCTTRAGAQYRVKSISSTGVATLVTDSGSFAMCSHVSVLQTIQTTQRGIASNPKTLPERLQWMADNLPGFKEELEAVNEAARRAHEKHSTPVPASGLPLAGTGVLCSAQKTTVYFYTPRVIREQTE